MHKVKTGIVNINVRCSNSQMHIKKVHFTNEETEAQRVYWGASLVAQLVKNPPAVWETWVQSLGCEDPLEKGMATHSSILA